jgi:sugar/nucleoside kinase (ribokinase family)
MVSLDVICVGAVTLDTIAVVPETPRDDERVLASQFVTAIGGPAATAAVALARLGARVGFCGVVGDDPEGRWLLDGLEREAVVTDWVRTAPGATTRSVVLVSESSAGRTIITQPAQSPRADDVPAGASSWIHVDQTGFGPARTALLGSTNRALFSVDGGNPIDTAHLHGVDLYAPSAIALRDRYADASDLYDAARLARQDGAGAVVATDGSRGSHIYTSDGHRHVPAFEVPVVSTLGAGDVFHGALLASLVRGAELVEAAREASAAAALSCRSIDGQSAIPRRAELDTYLSTQPPAPDTIRRPELENR